MAKRKLSARSCPTLKRWRLVHGYEIVLRKRRKKRRARRRRKRG